MFAAGRASPPFSGPPAYVRRPPSRSAARISGRCSNSLPVPTGDQAVDHDIAAMGQVSARIGRFCSTISTVSRPRSGPDGGSKICRGSGGARPLEVRPSSKQPRPAHQVDARAAESPASAARACPTRVPPRWVCAPLSAGGTVRIPSPAARASRSVSAGIGGTAPIFRFSARSCESGKSGGPRALWSILITTQKKKK